MGGAPKLATLAGAEKVGLRMKNAVWDTALLHPPGVRWGGAANLLLAPVVEYQAELAAGLR